MVTIHIAKLQICNLAIVTGFVTLSQNYRYVTSQNNYYRHTTKSQFHFCRKIPVTVTLDICNLVSWDVVVIVIDLF